MGRGGRIVADLVVSFLFSNKNIFIAVSDAWLIGTYVEPKEEERGSKRGRPCGITHF
jgi:hypothetical protein